MAAGGDKEALWSPAAGRVSVSDDEILADLVSQLAASQPLSDRADGLYAELKEVKRDADGWIKYYAISLALLALYAASGLSDLQLFGVRITGGLLAPASIVYFSLCLVVWTTYELKVRVYRRIFSRALADLQGAQRLAWLLRYPQAYSGVEFMPQYFKPATFVASARQAFVLLPAAVIFVVVLVAIVAAGWLSIYVTQLMWLNASIALAVKIGASLALAGAVITSGALLRSGRQRRTYATRPD